MSVLCSGKRRYHLSFKVVDYEMQVPMRDNVEQRVIVTDLSDGAETQETRGNCLPSCIYNSCNKLVPPTSLSVHKLPSGHSCLSYLGRLLRS